MSESHATLGTLERAAVERLLTSIAERPGLQDVLRVSILEMSKLFEIERVSVVLWKPGDELGFVVMEREHSLDNLIIRIEDYPELLEVIRRQEPVVISDVLADALLSGVRAKLQGARVPHRAAVLFPLLRQGQAVGALFLRSPAALSAVDAPLLAMGRIIAAITSIAIGHALEQELLLSEQRALKRESQAASEETEALRQFSAFFEHAHDGILVTDKKGAIRFANRAACSILDREAAALRGKRFVDLLSPRSHVLAERAFEGDAVGDGYGYVDLLVARADEQESVISAAIRRLEDDGSVVLSFRDVTELREIESELRQTKEFLENLIQSSVDGIVAADIRGRIILFNRGAEQITGFSAKEMVGKRNVRDMYPAGEAADVMRRLRSEGYGGRGRLEMMRKDLLTKEGGLVPVNMSAAVIYEGDEEVATVGIFTDLRERVRMEEKLAQVQSKLQLSERQAVAVELAGAAAHELNQPLTSIMGYAEMLRRRVSADDPNRKAIDTICQQTERVAAIVRKIGQITAYETKPYVGGSSIIDLAHAAQEGEGGAGDPQTPATTQAPAGTKEKS